MARCDTYHYALSPEDEQLVEELYKDGVSGREIATKFEVNYRSVYRALARRGVETRRKRNKNESFN
jgi:DNA invertase Pin-like site-specific DNA recombinase